MKTELYRVETTFLGADAPSKFYFDESIKAEKFLKEECQNGGIEKVGIISDYRLNYSDGCTWNDLTWGQDRKPKEVILMPEGWYKTLLLGEVSLNEYGHVVSSVTADGLPVYPYRLRMKRVPDVGGYRWVNDGWDNCSGEYTVSYLARLMREGKAKWN